MPYKNKEEKNRKARERYWESPEKSREEKRVYQKLAWAKLKKTRQPYSERRDKEIASMRVRFAVRKGWLIRPEGKQFHHTDYTRPYYGVWLTPTEHRAVHSWHMECPSCTDYSNIILPQQKEAKEAQRKKGGIAACKKRWKS